MHMPGLPFIFLIRSILAGFVEANSKEALPGVLATLSESSSQLAKLQLAISKDIRIQAEQSLKLQDSLQSLLSLVIDAGVLAKAGGKKVFELSGTESHLMRNVKTNIQNLTSHCIEEAQNGCLRLEHATHIHANVSTLFLTYLGNVLNDKSYRMVKSSFDKLSNSCLAENMKKLLRSQQLPLQDLSSLIQPTCCKQRMSMEVNFACLFFQLEVHSVSTQVCPPFNNDSSTSKPINSTSLAQEKLKELDGLLSENCKASSSALPKTTTAIATAATHSTKTSKAIVSTLQSSSATKAKAPSPAVTSSAKTTTTTDEGRFSSLRGNEKVTSQPATTVVTVHLTGTKTTSLKSSAKPSTSENDPIPPQEQTSKNIETTLLQTTALTSYRRTATTSTLASSGEISQAAAVASTETSRKLTTTSSTVLTFEAITATTSTTSTGSSTAATVASTTTTPPTTTTSTTPTTITAATTTTTTAATTVAPTTMKPTTQTTTTTYPTTTTLDFEEEQRRFGWRILGVYGNGDYWERDYGPNLINGLKKEMPEFGFYVLGKLSEAEDPFCLHLFDNRTGDSVEAFNSSLDFGSLRPHWDGYASMFSELDDVNLLLWSRQTTNASIEPCSNVLQLTQTICEPALFYDSIWNFRGTNASLDQCGQTASELSKCVRRFCGVTPTFVNVVCQGNRGRELWKHATSMENVLETKTVATTNSTCYSTTGFVHLPDQLADAWTPEDIPSVESVHVASDDFWQWADGKMAFTYEDPSWNAMVHKIHSLQFKGSTAWPLHALLLIKPIHSTSLVRRSNLSALLKVATKLDQYMNSFINKRMVDKDHTMQRGKPVWIPMDTTKPAGRFGKAIMQVKGAFKHLRARLQTLERQATSSLSATDFQTLSIGENSDSKTIWREIRNKLHESCTSPDAPEDQITKLLNAIQAADFDFVAWVKDWSGLRVRKFIDLWVFTQYYLTNFNNAMELCAVALGEPMKQWKERKEATQSKLKQIEAVFVAVEEVMKNGRFDSLRSLNDVPRFEIEYKFYRAMLPNTVGIASCYYLNGSNIIVSGVKTLRNGKDSNKFAVVAWIRESATTSSDFANCRIEASAITTNCDGFAESKLEAVSAERWDSDLGAGNCESLTNEFRKCWPQVQPKFCNQGTPKFVHIFCFPTGTDVETRGSGFISNRLMLTGNGNFTCQMIYGNWETKGSADGIETTKSTGFVETTKELTYEDIIGLPPDYADMI